MKTRLLLSLEAAIKAWADQECEAEDWHNAYFYDDQHIDMAKAAAAVFDASVAGRAYAKEQDAAEQGEKGQPKGETSGGTPDSPAPAAPDALADVIAALPEFRRQDDYLLAHGASLMSEDSHQILHIDTVRRIISAIQQSNAESKDANVNPPQLPPLTDAMYHAVRGSEYNFSSGGPTSVMGYLDDDCLDEIWDNINTALRVQWNAALKERT